jgi:hypothetical protein
MVAMAMKKQLVLSFPWHLRQMAMTGLTAFYTWKR